MVAYDIENAMKMKMFIKCIQQSFRAHHGHRGAWNRNLTLNAERAPCSQEHSQTRLQKKYMFLFAGFYNTC